MLTKFIKTSDKEIIEKLRKCGMYEVLDQEEGYVVFVNTGLHTLTEEEKKKVIFTNALNV